MTPGMVRGLIKTDSGRQTNPTRLPDQRDAGIGHACETFDKSV